MLSAIAVPAHKTFHNVIEPIDILAQVLARSKRDCAGALHLGNYLILVLQDFQHVGR